MKIDHTLSNEIRSYASRWPFGFNAVKVRLRSWARAVCGMEFDLAAARTELRTLADANYLWRGEYESLRGQIAVKDNDIDMLCETWIILRDACEELERDLDHATKHNDRIHAQLDALRTDKALQTQAIDNLESQNDELLRKLGSVQ